MGNCEANCLCVHSHPQWALARPTRASTHTQARTHAHPTRTRTRTYTYAYTYTLLAQDVFLYTTQEHDPVGLLYELECARLNRVVFQLDFAGSENFELAGGDDGMVLKVTAEPFKRVRMGKLLLKDPSSPETRPTHCHPPHRHESVNLNARPSPATPTLHLPRLNK